MRDLLGKRYAAEVPPAAEVSELNINVGQAGDDVSEFIEPVINDICDSAVPMYDLWVLLKVWLNLCFQM